MVKLSFPRKIIEREFSLTEKMVNTIDQLGTPVETCTEETLELEISTNRADLISVYGWMRALRAFTGKKVGLINYKLNNSHKKKFKVIIDKTVKSVRPHTVCAVVKNMSLNEEKLREIINLQEKMHATIGRGRKKFAIGIYP